MNTPKTRDFIQLPLEFPLVRQAAVQPRIRTSTSPQVAAALREICARAENGDSMERIRLARIYRRGVLVEKDFAEAERLLMKAGEWDWSEVMPDLFMLKEARYREIVWAASPAHVICWAHMPFVTHAQFEEPTKFNATAQTNFPLDQIRDLVDMGIVIISDDPAKQMSEKKAAGKVCLQYGDSLPSEDVLKMLASDGFIVPGRPVVPDFGGINSAFRRRKFLLEDESMPSKWLDLLCRRARMLQVDNFIDSESTHLDVYYIQNLALMRLGEMHLTGDGVKQDVELAESRFDAAANDRGMPLAKLRLAEFHLTQKERLDPEAAAEALWWVLEKCNGKLGDWSEYTDKAAALLIQGAKDGHAVVQRKLGEAYLEKWIDLDEEAALRQRQLGEVHLEKWIDLEKEAALRQMRRWEAAGCYVYAWPDERDKGGMKRHRLAAQLQRRLAAQLQRQEEAFFEMRTDSDEEFESVSSRLDAARSHWMAACCYAYPWPDEWDKEGMKWLRLAAQQGDKAAAKRLQEELEQGGVESTPPPELPEPDDFRVAGVRELEEKRERFHITDGKIYAIYDAVADCPIYVGQTRGDLESRISRYREEMAADGDNPRPIIRKLRELGENGHYFRVVERGIDNQGELDLAEEYWIAELGTYHKGYNATKDGQHRDRFRHR